jgi:hypothetical protein
MTHLESDVSRSKALVDDKTGAASSCYDTRPEVKLKGTGGGTRRGQTQEAAQPVALPFSAGEGRARLRRRRNTNRPN